MTTINAKRSGRIDVWPDGATARAADTEVSKRFGRMTIWPRASDARSHTTYDAGGGGDGGEYVAKAVHFDGTAWLQSLDNLGAIDGPNGIVSYWGKQASAGSLASGGNVPILENFFECCWIAGPGGGDGNAPENDAGLEFFDISRSGDNSLNIDTGASIFPSGTWFHCLMAWNTDFASGSRQVACYVNDVPHLFTITVSDDGVAFDIGYSNSPWAIGAYTDSDPSPSGLKGDMSDLYLNTVATIVQADGTISESDRRKFISADGKPVDLGVDGSTPTGSAPTIFCTGDATAWPTNAAGTGAFTLTGSLTNATTSPSD